MPEINKKKLAEDYGYALAFMKSDPDIWKLFNQAVKETWTDQEFEAKLRDSKWFQDHSATFRNNLLQKTSDPATWETRVLQRREELRDVVGTMGAEVGDSALQKMANDSLMYGWSESQIKNRMGGLVDTLGKTGHYGGQAGEDEASLRALASDYGVKLSGTTLKSWVRKIAKGDATAVDYKATVQRQAESTYSAYADQIKSGLTVRDIADPYIQSMAQTLEINPANVDLTDPTVRRALTYKDANTGKAREYSLFDFESDLRKDPRWARTKNAQDQAMNLGRQVLTDWGFM